MTDPDPLPAGWTLPAYVAHNEALREAEKQFQDERDRRYSEVSLEREKALKIKEEADKTALGLQRDTQVYKDEKANELRSQIERERGSYATKDDLVALEAKIDATVKPLVEFVSLQRGRSSGALDIRTLAFAAIASFVGVAGIVVAVIALVTKGG